MTFRLIGCGLLAAGLAAAHAQTPLCDRIKALAADPSVAAAHWGVSVTALDGTVLCGMNPAQLFRPASNAKLFTATAALALLGPARTFSTVVTGVLRPSGPSVVDGDLVLKGAGDGFLSERPMPYLSPGQRPAGAKARNPLEELADQVAASGVRHVTGDLIGDDTAWPYEPLPSDWSVDDLQWGFGAPVSALTVDDNKLALTVNPGAAVGSPATVTLDPTASFYQVQVSASTTALKTASNLAIERAPGSRLIRVYGTVPLGAPYEQDMAIADPAEYAAILFKTMLEARGITVDGHALARHQLPTRPDGFDRQSTEPLPGLAKTASPVSGPTCVDPCVTLATHLSPTLLDDVTLTLKVSQNLHAELLLHQLAAQFGSDGSTAQGARVVRQFLLNAGIAKDDFFLNDGSGLSTHDLTTPRALTQLLIFAAKQPWFEGFKSALPVGGVDGSLAARFKAPGTGPQIFAKTGTLGESRALSGYATTPAGKTLVFSVMVDTHAPNSSADRVAMDKMVEAIVSGN